MHVATIWNPSRLVRKPLSILLYFTGVRRSRTTWKLDSCDILNESIPLWPRFAWKPRRV